MLDLLLLIVVEFILNVIQKLCMSILLLVGAVAEAAVLSDPFTI